MSDSLCFIDAAHVTTPSGKLTGFKVRDAFNHNLGRLEGFVLDAGARRVRFLVVLCGTLLRKQKYLVPLRAARIEQGQRAMSVELDDNRAVRSVKFDSASFPDFSDEHLLAAMFASREAA
jgi:hypothetical protein